MRCTECPTHCVVVLRWSWPCEAFCCEQKLCEEAPSSLLCHCGAPAGVFVYNIYAEQRQSLIPAGNLARSMRGLADVLSEMS